MREIVYKRIWELSPFVDNSSIYSELVKLTSKLISIYNEQGRIDINPFETVKDRTVSLDHEQLVKRLKGRVCLVTGGLGCVGSQLVHELLQFEPKQIIIIDKRIPSPDDVNVMNPLIAVVHCDVTDKPGLLEIFNQYQPEFVFHTAAQRNPGLAEKQVLETIETNIFGTINVIDVCKRTSSVKQFVFSSTGKASRYLTEEIYAATKKFCEYIIETESRNSPIKFSMVRFTHILDNSLMNQELEEASMKDAFVAVHSPAKYVTAQNVKEAAALMLNSLLVADTTSCYFLIVKNLEWPVESLEMALHYINNSGRNIPVLFTGNPLGYSEKFFRGQMNWADPANLNLLINVYECNNCFEVDQSGDIIISKVLPVDRDLLTQILSALKVCSRVEEAKELLINGLYLIVKEMIIRAPKNETFDILKWGLDKEWMKSERTLVSDYGPIVPLMLNSLHGTPYYQKAQSLFDITELRRDLIQQFLHQS